MYAVIKNGTLESEAVGNIVWSPNHFQTAESLSPEERAEFDLYLIVDNQPELTATQKWDEPTYEVSGTDVIRTWVAMDKTNDELAVDLAITAEGVRSERDSRLAATDWTALSDITMTAEMTTYRQALRDVPAQAGFPQEITWPVEAEV